jgi:hypothetical protein
MKDINKAVLENLLLDLQKNMSVPGAAKHFCDAIRGVTQIKTQKYTITKKFKEVFTDWGIEVPDTMTQQERKTYSTKLKNAGFPIESQTNQSPTQIEHGKEIKTMKDELLDKKDYILSLSKDDAIQYLANYFETETRAFHKLSVLEKDLQLRNGVSWEEMQPHLVDSTKTRLILS